MLRLEKWSRLSNQEKKMLLRASLHLIVIYVGLRLFSFHQFRRLFAWWIATNKKQDISKDVVDLTCWAIKSAAYHLPLTLLCLPQSLTAKVLLRKDPAIRVPIGVLLQEDGHLEAHAWVERKGEIVLGELPDKHFQPIWEWQ